MQHPRRRDIPTVDKLRSSSWLDERTFLVFKNYFRRAARFGFFVRRR
jgi:hypothetical protein